MRVFPDTNVWLSATLFSGLCSELVLGCVANGFPLLTTALIREEALAVMADKFAQRTDAPPLFDAIWCEGQLVADCAAPADDNDVRLVTAAATAGADLFVTGDKRVLGWRERDALCIVTPREAWIILFGAGAGHRAD